MVLTDRFMCSAGKRFVEESYVYDFIDSIIMIHMKTHRLKKRGDCYDDIAVVQDADHLFADSCVY